MIVINKNIKNETYDKLINYAFNSTDTIMFAFYDKNSNEYNSLKNKLKKFDKYILNPKSEIHELLLYQHDMVVNFYKNNNSIKEYLLINKSLYSWDFPEYPTDICFFKNNICWLRSVTHEEMCDIYPNSKEEYEYLKSIGIKFYEKNFKPVSKEELITIDLDSN